MKSYGQFCALARALEEVGDRWTLLVVRELLLGPRRYTDLRAALPGVATNLLGDRLRRLEADGLLRRYETPPPTPAVLLELTDRGRGLADVVDSLMRWGMPLLGEPVRADEAFSVHWMALVLRSQLRPGEPEAVEVWEIVVDGHGSTRVLVGDGPARLAPSAAEPVARAVFADIGVMSGLIAGELNLSDAITGGRLRLEGDAAAVERLTASLPIART